MPNINTKNPRGQKLTRRCQTSTPRVPKLTPTSWKSISRGSNCAPRGLNLLRTINLTLTLRTILIIGFLIKSIGFSERRKNKILVNFNFFSVVNDFNLVLVFSQSFTQFLMFIIVIKKVFFLRSFFFDLKNVKVAWKNGENIGYFYFFCLYRV